MIISSFNDKIDAPIKTSFVGVLLTCTALTSLPAIAQDRSSGEESIELQDIVVVAQRREQNVQDTPISVAAFNQEALKSSGVASVAELSHVVPSLNFSGNVGVVYPFLRGIGNIAAGTPGNESSVAMYLDDVYYTRLSPAYLALGDIDHVEVLNGPQGTLFGRNSSGGAIQMFTRDPGSKAAMDASVSYASFQTVSGNAYLSVPLSDTLAWNIAAAGSDQSKGWGRNIVTGKDAYYQNFMTVRSKLLWEPSDATRMKLVVHYARTKGDIGNASSIDRGTNVNYPNWGPTPPPGYPVAPALLPSLQNNASTYYDTQLNFRNVADEYGYGASLRIDQDVGFADLVSISAFRNSKGKVAFDDDYTPQNFANVYFNIFDDDISQEFQLKSKKDSKISWILGLYYLHNKAGTGPLRLDGDLLDLTVAPGAFLEGRSTQKLDSYSGFAQATAPVSDKTNVTVGLRYTKDHLQGLGTQSVVIPGVVTFPFPGAVTPFASTNNSHAFTYRFAVDHHFTDDVMTYASVSRGYKAGTFNTVPLEEKANRPEIVDAYEIGFKSELLDRRVRLNGALFWNDIKDPQVQVFLTKNGIPSTSLLNAESARTKGGELQIEALATQGLRLRGSVTYVEAKYTSFRKAPFYSISGGALVGPVQGDASGNRMPVNPKWSWAVGANYVLDSSIGTWNADVSATYKGKFYWSPDNLRSQKAVTLVNASFNFTPASSGWLTMGIWGKNLTKERYNVLVQGQVFSLGNSEFQSMPGAPRTFGGTITMKY